MPSTIAISSRESLVAAEVNGFIADADPENVRRAESGAKGLMLRSSLLSLQDSLDRVNEMQGDIHIAQPNRGCKAKYSASHGMNQDRSAPLPIIRHISRGLRVAAALDWQRWEECPPPLPL